MFFERLKNIFVGRFKEVWNNFHLLLGFSTRLGGVSYTPFHSLNLGLNTPDDQNLVQENRKRFFQAVEINDNQLVIPQQVHSGNILAVDRPGRYPEIDGLVTDRSGLVLSLQLADCLPIFMVDRKWRAIGLIHAGWRGTRMKIGPKAVRTLEDLFKIDPHELLIFFGPSIGPCCYDIGNDVADLFPSHYQHKGKLDLWSCNQDQLIQAGIEKKQIIQSHLCTRCLNNLFFSHRASGGNTGRMMAVLELR
jgi:YfiH family protein